MYEKKKFKKFVDDIGPKPIKHFHKLPQDDFCCGEENVT